MSHIHPIKRFLEVGRILFIGCFWHLGDLHLLILIAEGIATASSLHAATGLPKVATLMSHNLVARALGGRFPTAEIIVAGDDDAAKPENPGRTAALQAAETVNGAAVFPDFGKDRVAHETDFNDLAVRYGLAAVKKQNSYLFNIALFDAVEQSHL